MLFPIQGFQGWKSLGCIWIQELDLDLDLDLDYISMDLKCLDSKSINFKILLYMGGFEIIKFKIYWSMTKDLDQIQIPHHFKLFKKPICILIT